MTFQQKVAAVAAVKAQMDSSKRLCLADAVRHHEAGRTDMALRPLEKAAQYAWGFWRPQGW